MALAGAGMDLAIASRKPEHLQETRAAVEALGQALSGPSLRRASCRAD